VLAPCYLKFLDDQWRSEMCSFPSQRRACAVWFRGTCVWTCLS
jgi:hypothetical protein